MTASVYFVLDVFNCLQDLFVCTATCYSEHGNKLLDDHGVYDHELPCRGGPMSLYAAGTVGVRDGILPCGLLAYAWVLFALG